ncbi:TPA: phosphohydrolase [Candidatus Sumerlaeota bacterium]|jgi:HD-like signal output (HDOD) protein|nr:phosphohydrolase [Candidatus Sumerlaeota bacterium]
MRQTALEDLIPGMVTAEEVKDVRGRILIAAGAVLEEKHLRALKMWGVTTVSIEGEDEETQAEEQEERLDPAMMERVRGYANEMFLQNYENREFPMFKTLFILSVKRLARAKNIAPEYSFPQTFDSPLNGASDVTHVSGGNHLTAADMVAQTKTLASLPSIYEELMKVVNHPHSSATDVANVIASDPSLTARLLRIVNSTFYSFPAKIDTVSRAITIVGTAQLCDLALATSVMSTFGKTLDGIVNMELFWKHSVAVGVFARQFAGLRREANTEGYFVMGLLHDLGRLIVYAQAPELARTTLDESLRRKTPMYAVEKEIFGFNHADVGMALLEAWNLPHAQREATGRHHRPDAATRFPNEAAIIHVADVIANALRMGRSGDLYVPPLHPEAWDKIGVDHTLLPELVKDAETQVSDLMRIFAQD